MPFYLTNLLAQNDKKTLFEIFSQIPSSTFIIFGLLLVVVFLLMRSTHRRSIEIRNRNRGMTAREMVDQQMRDNPNHSIERLQELMAALADMSREINGQIDTRTAKLEILMAQADNQMTQMRQLVSELRMPERRKEIDRPDHGNTNDSARHKEPGNLRNNVKPITIATVPYTDTTTADIDFIIDNGGEKELTNNKPMAEKMPEVELKAVAENETVEPDNKKQILELAQSGLPIADIARLTGRPSGEVELILNLSGFKNRK